jgi:hypothetical protein
VLSDFEYASHGLNGARFSIWLKSPAAISADMAPSAPGKKRGFCRLRLRVVRPKRRTRAKKKAGAGVSAPAVLRGALQPVRPQAMKE